MIRTICFAVSIELIVATAGFAQGAALIQQGEKAYAAQKCAACHSIAGKGNQKGPLDGVGSKLSADEIRMWMVSPVEMTAKTKASRKPPMKAYSSIPKAELDAIVAYMQSLKK